LTDPLEFEGAKSAVLSISLPIFPHICCRNAFGASANSLKPVAQLTAQLSHAKEITRCIIDDENAKRSQMLTARVRHVALRPPPHLAAAAAGHRKRTQTIGSCEEALQISRSEPLTFSL